MEGDRRLRLLQLITTNCFPANFLFRSRHLCGFAFESQIFKVSGSGLSSRVSAIHLYKREAESRPIKYD